MNVVEGSVPETEKRWKKYVQVDNHGLVGLKPDGEMGVNIPGHEFGKAEITAKIDELLAMKSR